MTQYAFIMDAYQQSLDPTAPHNTFPIEMATSPLSWIEKGHCEKTTTAQTKMSECLYCKKMVTDMKLHIIWNVHMYILLSI